MADIKVCDICGKPIPKLYMVSRKFRYYKKFFVDYTEIDICEQCGCDIEEYIRKKRAEEV